MNDYDNEYIEKWCKKSEKICEYILSITASVCVISGGTLVLGIIGIMGVKLLKWIFLNLLTLF